MEFLQLVGFLLPPVIDTINVHIPNSNLRFWVSVLFCAVVGVIIHLVNGGGFGAENINALSTTMLSVFATAQLSYKAVWEKSDVRSDLNLGH